MHSETSKFKQSVFFYERLLFMRDFQIFQSSSVPE